MRKEWEPVGVVCAVVVAVAAAVATFDEHWFVALAVALGSAVILCALWWEMVVVFVLSRKTSVWEWWIIHRSESSQRRYLERYYCAVEKRVLRQVLKASEPVKNPSSGSMAGCLSRIDRCRIRALCPGRGVEDIISDVVLISRSRWWYSGVSMDPAGSRESENETRKFNINLQIRKNATPTDWVEFWKGRLCKSDREHRPQAIPLVLWRRHLNFRSALEEGLGWSFQIVLLFAESPSGGLKVSLNTDQHGRRPAVFRIGCDEHDAPCGIWSNEGKRFIFAEDIPTNRLQNMLRLAAQLHKFLLGYGNAGVQGDGVKEISWRYIVGNDLDGLRVPLRWASGGGMAIVKGGNDGRRSVALFFRDIKVRGWNIANGASEMSQEWYDLDRLCSRELTEELMLFLPGKGEVKCFRHSNWDHRGQFDTSRKKRKDDDGLKISEDSERFEVPPTLAASASVSQIKIQGSGDVKSGSASSYLVSVNPLEFGIEIIKPVELTLKGDSTLLDGETSPGGGLVRRPVLLWDVDWLRSVVVGRGGSLAGRRYLNDDDGFSAEPSSYYPYEPREDCVFLPPIPSNKFALNDADVMLRRLRLRKISATLGQASKLKRDERNSLEKERDSIRKWLVGEKYAREGVSDKSLEGTRAESKLSVQMLREVRWLIQESGDEENEPSWHGCVDVSSSAFPDSYGLLFRLMRKLLDGEIDSVSIDGRIIAYKPKPFPEGSQPEDSPFPNPAKITSISRLCAVTWKSVDMAFAQGFFGKAEHGGTSSRARV